MLIDCECWLLWKHWINFVFQDFRRGINGYVEKPIYGWSNWKSEIEKIHVRKIQPNKSPVARHDRQIHLNLAAIIYCCAVLNLQGNQIEYWGRRHRRREKKKYKYFERKEENVFFFLFVRDVISILKPTDSDENETQSEITDEWTTACACVYYSLWM